MAQTKAEQDNVVESLEDDEIKETNAEKENTSNDYVCNICKIYFVYEEGLFEYVSNNHKDCTISNIRDYCVPSSVSQLVRI